MGREEGLYSLHDLMSRVAQVLAGKAVRVRQAYHPDVTGATWKDEDGITVIDIMPGLTEQTEAYVFLHEVSHAKYHPFRRVSESEVRAYTYDNTKPVNRLRESQADEQAKVWLEYAERYRDTSLPYLEGILWPLLDYKEVST